MISSASHRTLEQFPFLIPGIEKVIHVSSSSDYQQYTGLVIEKEKENYQINAIGVNAVISFIKEVMQRGIPYQWYAKSEIPFEITPKHNIQLTIFNELKNSVLVLSYSHFEYNFKEIYFVYFNENLSNFLLEKVSEPFSSQHKKMVGFLVYNAVTTLMTLFRSQEELSLDTRRRIEDLVLERDRLRELDDQMKNRTHNDYLTMAQHYLDKICRESHLHAVLDESANRKILTFQGDLYLLESILRDALDFAQSLSPSSLNKRLVLTDYHILFPEKVSLELPKDTIDGLSERFQKTHLLLDKLELAASGLKEKRGQLTSANVGREFTTPISAPAITDALKKHKKRILDLFDRYPEKWVIIRHEFRPVQNLLNSINQDEALSA